MANYTLQEHAKALVQAGATMEVLFPDRAVLGPYPVVALAVTDSTVMFTWLGDDRTHEGAVEEAEPGDDGEVVFTIANGQQLSLFGLWRTEDNEALAAYSDSVLRNLLPLLDVPEGVRYSRLAAV